jgi:hypothetical protein
MLTQGPSQRTSSAKVLVKESCRAADVTVAIKRTHWAAAADAVAPDRARQLQRRSCVIGAVMADPGSPPEPTHPVRGSPGRATDRGREEILLHTMPEPVERRPREGRKAGARGLAQQMPEVLQAATRPLLAGAAGEGHGVIARSPVPL